MKFKKGREYRIEWLDHIRYEATEWRSPKDHDILEPERITTLGTCVKDAKNHVVLAGNYSPDATMHEMCILKGTIEDAREIKLG